MKNIVIAKEILKLAKEVIALDRPDGKEEGTEFKGVKRNDKPSVAQEPATTDIESVRDFVYDEYSRSMNTEGYEVVQDVSEIVNVLKQVPGVVQNEADKSFSFTSDDIRGIVAPPHRVLVDGKIPFRVHDAKMVMLNAGAMKSFDALVGKCDSIELTNMAESAILKTFPATFSCNEIIFASVDSNSLDGIPECARKVSIFNGSISREALLALNNLDDEYELELNNCGFTGFPEGFDASKIKKLDATKDFFGGSCIDELIHCCLRKATDIIIHGNAYGYESQLKNKGYKNTRIS